jgi:hypothetical protein
VREFRGRCHCGALKVTYRTKIDPAHWPLRHDGCSFCRRHGVVASSDPVGQITFEFEDPSKVLRYRFGHKTAEFLICRECGVFLAAVCGGAGAERAVVNTRVLEDALLNFNNVSNVRFDHETPAQRDERRLRHWTPVRTAAV